MQNRKNNTVEALKLLTRQIVEEELKSGTKALKVAKNKPLVRKGLKGNILVCPICGNIVSKDHNFCYDCGARLK